MGWITIYITGKSDFKEEVMRHLEHSGFKFMPGFSEDRNLCLFWIDERASLREFKKAIGSKTVFKHRLQFFCSVEEFVESRNNFRTLDKFTPQEELMIQEMNRWQEDQQIKSA